MLLDVELADRVAQVRVHHAHAALPAHARQDLAGDDRAEEVETRVVERVAQVGCRRGHIAGDEPRAPRGKRHLGHQRGKGRKERRLREDHRGRSIDPLRPRPRRPVEARHLDRQLPQREPPVGRGIAALGLRPLDAREGRLECEHRLCVFLGCRASGELEDARQVLLIFDPDAGERLVVLQVVVAIGQERAALRDAGDRSGPWTERVDADRSAEGAAGRNRRQVASFGRQIAGRADGVDAPELGLTG